MTPLEMYDVLSNHGHVEIKLMSRSSYFDRHNYEYSASLTSFHNDVWIETAYGELEDDAVTGLYQFVKDQVWCMCEYIENELRR